MNTIQSSQFVSFTPRFGQDSTPPSASPAPKTRIALPDREKHEVRMRDLLTSFGNLLLRFPPIRARFIAAQAVQNGLDESYHHYDCTFLAPSDDFGESKPKGTHVTYKDAVAEDHHETVSGKLGPIQKYTDGDTQFRALVSTPLFGRPKIYKLIIVPQNEWHDHSKDKS